MTESCRSKLEQQFQCITVTSETTKAIANCHWKYKNRKLNLIKNSNFVLKMKSMKWLLVVQKMWMWTIRNEVTSFVKNNNHNELQQKFVFMKEGKKRWNMTQKQIDSSSNSIWFYYFNMRNSITRVIYC